MSERTVTFRAVAAGGAKNNIKYSIPLPAKEGFKSCFVFGFPKAGTVLLNSIVHDIMNFREIPIIDLPKYLWERGIDFHEVLVDLDEVFLPYGYCYAGYREVWPRMAFNSVVRDSPKVFITRHPFDILVSRYFSLRHSHTFPQHKTPQFHEFVSKEQNAANKFDLDNYAISNAKFLRQNYMAFKPLLDLESTKILRYEDYIYNKADLISAITGWFNIHIEATCVEGIALRHHIIPEIENPLSHVRQVHPGDGERKLRPETLALLGRLLEDIIDYFGYG
jgi:hypothetical protein